MNMEERKEYYEFRTVRENEAEEAARIEAVCFPPSEACTLPIMKQRVQAAPELFIVAEEKSTGRPAGFINAIATDEASLRDAFFTDISLHNPQGKNIMILSVAVLPQHRGRGLAGAMMREMVKRQKAAGKKAAVLTCLASRIGLYAGMGFADRGVSDSSWGGESWHEMVLSFD